MKKQLMLPKDVTAKLKNLGDVASKPKPNISVIKKL